MGVGQLIRNVITVETDPTVANFTKSLTSSNTILTAVNAASGTISASVLPSYVDDVLNFANLATFPVAGETGKIYVTEDTNKTYRWSGSVYVEISSSATAGEALKLTTPRTISGTGDATFSVNFDGSANVSGAITLATVNGNVGGFGDATQSPVITVDAKGRITAVSNSTIAPPWSAIASKPTTLSGFGITDALPLSGGTVTGVTNFSNATPSTSTTTGGVVVSGGVGVGGAVFARNLYTTGNVGIGNTTPTTTLHVGGGNGNLHVLSNGGMLIKGDSGDRSLLEVHSPDGFSRTVLQCINSGPTYLLSLDGRSLALQTSGGNVGIGTANPSQKLDVNGSAKATSFVVGTNQVVSARRTGWAAPTGTATRTTFETSTVTLPQLAERVKALIDDLINHGLIGA